MKKAMTALAALNLATVFSSQVYVADLGVVAAFITAAATSERAAARPR